jgi:hypothetical protein
MKQRRARLEKQNVPEEGKKRGCRGSTTLAIAVAKRSWHEISLWETQQMKNSLNFVTTCLKVVDTRRSAITDARRDSML